MQCEFACHGQKLQLSGGAAHLACGNHISPQLRARSPVYYWLHGPSQTRPNREAVCEKKTARWHVITFGSHSRYAEAAKSLCATLRSHANVDSCSALTASDIPENVKRAIGINGSISSVVQTTRGFGYWRWKPFLLFDRLSKLEDNDVMIWMDRDMSVSNRSVAPLFCIGQQVALGVAGFHTPCLVDRPYTKRAVVTDMNATADQLDTATVWAGLIVFRKNAFSLRFLREWREQAAGTAFEDTLPKPGSGASISASLAQARKAHEEDATYLGHRHDQACLSLLLKQYGLKTFPVPIATHDVRDVWVWEAGFCDVEWPLEPGIVSSFYGRAEAVFSYCEKLQGFSPPPNDYVGVTLAPAVRSSRSMSQISAIDR